VPTRPIASDLDVLMWLNDEYIQCVKKSDVGRFREILAHDFLCTLPDGAIVDRNEFLDHIAKPYTLGDLQADDVNVSHGRLRDHPCAHGVHTAGWHTWIRPLHGCVGAARRTMARRRRARDAK